MASTKISPPLPVHHLAVVVADLQRAASFYEDVLGLREIRRIMAVGGRLFVADFQRHADETMRSRYGDRWLGFDEQQLGIDLGAAGFKVLHCKHMPVDRNMTLLLLSAEAC